MKAEPTSVPASGSLAIRTVQGTLWMFASRYGGKVIALVSTVVLARLLSQQDFGVAGYAVVFIGFLEMLEGFGVGPAVIYHADDEDTLNTAFWLALLTGLVLLAVTWLAAPLAAEIFGDPRAVPVTRALALVFPLAALRTVPRALLRRNLQFGRLMIPDLTSALTKGGAAIGFAFFGFGAWSLIWGQVAGSAVDVIASWTVSPMPRLRLRFDRASARPLLSYGGGIAGLNVVAAILRSTDFLFVGRYLGAAALGVYTVAFRIPELIVRQLVTTISQVTFPVFVRMRAESQPIAHGWLTTLRYVAMLTIPVGLGLALVAEEFVLTVLGGDWENAIGVTAAISLYSLVHSLAFNTGDVYKAQGRIRLMVGLALAQAVVLIPALWYAAAQLGTVAAVAWTMVGVQTGVTAIRLLITGRILKVPVRRIAGAIGAPLAAGALMVVALISVDMLVSVESVAVRLALKVTVGAGVYVAAGWLLFRRDIRYALRTIRVALSTPDREQGGDTQVLTTRETDAGTP